MAFDPNDLARNVGGCGRRHAARRGAVPTQMRLLGTLGLAVGFSPIQKRERAASTIEVEQVQIRAVDHVVNRFAGLSQAELFGIRHPIFGTGRADPQRPRQQSLQPVDLLRRPLVGHAIVQCEAVLRPTPGSFRGGSGGPTGGRARRITSL